MSEGLTFFTSTTNAIATLIALFILFAPLALAVAATIKIHKQLGGGAAHLLSFGVIMFSLLPLDLMISMAGAFMDTQALAEFMLIKSYISMTLTYLGAISTAVGILILCQRQKNTV